MARFSILLLSVFAFTLSVGAVHVSSAGPLDGQIVGRVRLDGRIAYPRMLAVTKHREFCGNAVRNEAVQLGRDGELRNTVVSLRGPGLDGRSGGARRITLDNVDCRFVPHVQAVPLGGTLLLLNSDPILHDAHGRLRGRTLFNDGLPTWRRVERRLDRTGVLEIVCELHHAWMRAYVVVTPNDYFAVTDAEGRFRIPDVPAGTYEIEFWHEKLGKVRRNVRVEKDRVARIEAIFHAP
jgi:plastocyanin